MAAYQLRRCAQELTDAERAELLRRVRPAALSAAQAPDPAAELARSPAAPAQPGSAAAAPPYGDKCGRSEKRRRLANGNGSERADDREGTPCASGPDLRRVDAGSWESGEEDCADGGTNDLCGARRRRLASADSWGSGGRQHADGVEGLMSAKEPSDPNGSGEGVLSAQEERAVALLALAASKAPAQGPARPPTTYPGSEGGACDPDALQAHTGTLRAHSPAAAPAQGPARVPGSGGAAADAAGWEAGAGVGLGLTADATRVLAALSPDAVRRVLAALAARFPRSTAALLSGALPPAAAELLITQLEAADAELAAAGALSCCECKSEGCCSPQVAGRLDAAERGLLRQACS